MMMDVLYFTAYSRLVTQFSHREATATADIGGGIKKNYKDPQTIKTRKGMTSVAVDIDKYIVR